MKTDEKMKKELKQLFEFLADAIKDIKEKQCKNSGLIWYFEFMEKAQEILKEE